MDSRKILANNLDFYMKLNEKSRKDLSKDLGIPYATITDWILARKYPRIDKIERLAEYFCISVKDLTTEQEQRPIIDISVNDLTHANDTAKRLMTYYAKLANLKESDREMILGMIDRLDGED